MDIRKLTEQVSVAPQIAITDIPAIAAQGFTAIVCNRPDYESPDQPLTEDVARAAQEAGLSFHHIPIAGGQFTPEMIDAFASLDASAESPVLAYCLSGTRSTYLWALAEVRDSGVDAVIATAMQAGYDLAPARQMLEMVSAQSTD